MGNPYICADLSAPVFVTPGDKSALATGAAIVRDRLGEQGIVRRT